MSNIEQLKREARQLLEEVNTTGNKYSALYGFQSFGESSFKDRLKQLKERLFILQQTPPSPGNVYR